MFLRMEGGWLDCLCTYSGMFPSFVYGECFPLFRSRVTSKKLTLVRLVTASTVDANLTKVNSRNATETIHVPSGTNSTKM